MTEERGQKFGNFAIIMGGVVKVLSKRCLRI